MSKKILIGVSVTIIVLLGFWVISARFFDMFKDTAYLNLEIDLETLQKIEVYGMLGDMAAFDERYGYSRGIYIDKKKIKRIVEFLESTPLVEVELEKERIRPSQSPDGSLRFYDNYSNIVVVIEIYAGSYVKQYDSSQYYRSKNDRVKIRDSLIEMKFN